MSKTLWRIWRGVYKGVELQWNPRDMWVGVYWQTDACGMTQDQTAVYICIIPTVVIRIDWTKTRKPPAGYRTWSDYNSDDGK